MGADREYSQVITLLRAAVIAVPQRVTDGLLTGRELCVITARTDALIPAIRTSSGLLTLVARVVEVAVVRWDTVPRAGGGGLTGVAGAVTA